MPDLSENDLELAAIELCKLRGQDPHETLLQGGPDGLDVALYTPRWQFAAAEIKRHLEIEQAIKAAEVILYNRSRKWP